MELEFVPVQQARSVSVVSLRERCRLSEAHQDAASLAQDLPLVGRETIHECGRARDVLDLDRSDLHKSSLSIA